MLSPTPSSTGNVGDLKLKMYPRVGNLNEALRSSAHLSNPKVCNKKEFVIRKKLDKELWFYHVSQVRAIYPQVGQFGFLSGQIPTLPVVLRGVGLNIADFVLNLVCGPSILHIDPRVLQEISVRT